MAAGLLVRRLTDRATLPHCSSCLCVVLCTPSSGSRIRQKLDQDRHYCGCSWGELRAYCLSEWHRVEASSFCWRKGTYAPIAPRSGLATKHHLQVGSSVVGPGYHGNLAVVLLNHAAGDLTIYRGDRVALLILERFAVPEVVLVPVLLARPLYSPHQHQRGLPSTHPSFAAPSKALSSSFAAPLSSSATLSTTPPTSLSTPLSAALSSVRSSSFAAPMSTLPSASTTAASRPSRRSDMHGSAFAIRSRPTSVKTVRRGHDQEGSQTHTDIRSTPRGIVTPSRRVEIHGCEPVRGPNCGHACPQGG